MKATRLLAVPWTLVASPDILAKLPAITSPRDMDPTRCMPLGGRPWRFQRGRSRVELTPSGQMASNSGAVAVQAALAGLGIALVPADYAQAHLDSGRLVHLLPDWLQADASTFHLVFQAGRYMPRRVRVLIDLLHARLRDAPTSR